MNNQDCTRRDFMKKAGTGAVATAGASMMYPDISKAVEELEPMKITKIDAVTFKNAYWTWMRLHTDKGLIGYGETYPRTNSELGAMKDMANLIIGKDPRQIERVWRDNYARSSFSVTGGAEMRVLSATNCAQLDIVGQALGVPMYQLLGGKAQDSLRIYSTYFKDLRINGMVFKDNVEKVTRFLLDKGVKAIKIYPYDDVARKNNYNYMSAVETVECLDWVKRIRDTAGLEMEICIDTMCKLNLPMSLRAAKSLEPYDILFLEDFIHPDNPQAYKVLANETSIPLCHSERLATRYQFREMLEEEAVDIVMYDLTWVGGPTEAKKISDMADTYYVPTSPHTAGGPLLYLSSIQTAASLTNMFIMESSYKRWAEDYPKYIEDCPVPINGAVTPPDTPGLGVKPVMANFTNGEATVHEIASL
jgi:galactonate dehydratase